MSSSRSSRSSGGPRIPRFEPLVPVCREPMSMQIEVARSKIDDSLVTESGETLSEREAMYALTTVWRHGDFARSFKWAPNHTDALEGHAPSGFQFNVSPRSPVFPASPFSRDCMFNGIMAFPLDAGLSSNCVGTRPLTLDYLYDSRNRIMERLGEAIGAEDLGDGTDDTNFVGIFSSSGRRDAHVDAHFWCVVQCNNAAISRSVFDMVERAEPDSIEDTENFAIGFTEMANEYYEREYRAEHNIQTTTVLDGDGTAKESRVGPLVCDFTTWDELFFKNEEMRRLQRDMEMHRVGVLCKALRALGLGLTERGSSKDEVLRATLANKSLVHNVFNTVEQIDISNDQSDLVYLSNLTSIHTVGNAGVALRESPALGVTILPGPWDKQRVVDAVAVSHLPFVGAPTATGMRRSNALLFANGESIDTAESVFQQKRLSWTVDAEVDRRHMLFDVRNTRVRKRNWKKWEVACGFASKPVVLSGIKVVYSKPRNTGML